MGLFFTSRDPLELEKAQYVLISKGYSFVDIYISEKDNPGSPYLFRLHAEKVEHHTPQSVDARNDELNIFAHEPGLESYDGMDVGTV